MSAVNNMRICLNEVVFFGYHGLYADEKKLGNTYKVDVHIDFTPKVSIIDQLDQTIDYVHVYALVKKRMEIPTPLLETLVATIAEDILTEQPIADKVFVKITKVIMPIPQFDGNASVSIEKSRSK
jgi:dihydroneopterin aldolase